MASRLENIILDLDGTLIDHHVAEFGNDLIIRPRPFLSAFLEHLFFYYERVSIWTNGTDKWFAQCYDTCLKYHLPRGKRFDLVITFNDRMVADKERSPKRLSLLYDKYPFYHSRNTLIIDDSPHTVVDNPNNAILLPTFNFDLDKEDDTELIKVLFQLMDKRL